MAGDAGELSVDEIIATLSKTSLRTIVVEGNDDVVAYRGFERALEDLAVSVFPVGGREKVLSVFQRRNEIKNTEKILFVADKDTWVYSAVPAEYVAVRLKFTDGYSIENDTFSDVAPLNLMSAAERTQFGSHVFDFVEWYALALQRMLDGGGEPISLHPSQVLDAAVRPALLALKPDEPYPAELRNQIQGDYGRLLRGKSLMALVMLILNRPGRAARHTCLSLMEGVGARPGPLIQAMIDWARASFTPAAA
jgi:hypothetical protein